MVFTNSQLQKMGQVARDELKGGIEVDTTNLHGGTTIVMKGVSRRSTSTKQIEVLVTANGQTCDLSRLSSDIRAAV